jgi:hypothetical protein
MNKLRSKVSCFKNDSQLGSFGEYVYKKFCEKQSIQISRTNYCNTDFVLMQQGSTEKIFVDVKATQTNPDGYRGKRFGDKIVYESITVIADRVVFIPDASSPFSKMGKQELGLLEPLLKQWKVEKEAYKEQRRPVLTDAELTSLRSVFSKSSFPKIRLVERGDASGKRWTGKVDNLPGSASIIQKYDATLFVQYGCKDFEHVVMRLILIPHRLLIDNQVRLAEPTARQKNKGISQVLDLEAYSRDYPHHIFPSMDALKSFLLSN